MATDHESKSSVGKSATIWALITGLAVGFAVGRETGGGRRQASSDEGNDSAPSAAAGKADSPSAPSAKAPSKIYKNEGEFPPGWLKAADLTAGMLDGLNDKQKVTVVQALNERNCECGCNYGTIANCIKRDPNCPKSPQLGKLAVEQAKQGKDLAAILGALDAAQPKKPAGSPPAAADAPKGPRKVELTAHSPRKGASVKNAKVTIVEWSDFECPFCSRVVPTLKEIESKYGKDVAVIFRHQPLSFHPNAKPAAIASMAAHNQGKFWEMHDKLFANARALTRPDLEKYGQELGLNMARFKKDMDDPKTKELVEKDSADGTAVGANGTPAFYINGRELSGAQPFPAFQAVIDEEIKKADALIKGGTPVADVYKKLMEQAAAAPPPAAAAPAAAVEPAAKVDIAAATDSPVKGPANAPVTIIEFSEFQCPFCSRVGPALKQVEDEYKGKVKIVFQHLPLPFHNNAQIAAEASMAAHEQGKFWVMHDKLFQNQQALDRPSLEKYAEELGLNLGKFKAALDSGKFKSKVEKDAKQAESVGATGTPTFFINGTRLVGAQPFDAFKKAIDDELQKKGK